MKILKFDKINEGLFSKRTELSKIENTPKIEDNI